jgi:hypothetical protein
MDVKVNSLHPRLDIIYRIMLFNNIARMLLPTIELTYAPRLPFLACINFDIKE